MLVMTKAGSSWLRLSLVTGAGAILIGSRATLGELGAALSPYLPLCSAPARPSSSTLVCSLALTRNLSSMPGMCSLVNPFDCAELTSLVSQRNHCAKPLYHPTVPKPAHRCLSQPRRNPSIPTCDPLHPTVPNPTHWHLLQ